MFPDLKFLLLRLSKQTLMRVILSFCFLLGICSVGFGSWVFVGATQAYEVLEPDVIACPQADSQDEKVTPPEESRNVTVAISGAVSNPGMYQLANGSRVGDLVTTAGGFASNADSIFVQTTLNLAHRLNDAEGVYIPFLEDQDVLDVCSELTTLLQTAHQSAATEKTAQNEGEEGTVVSINFGSVEQLDTLPGVGAKRAEAIVANRPYARIEELVEKEVLSESVFEELKQLIQL